MSPARAEDDLARETASHLALLEDEYRRRGMSEREACFAALRAFGGIEQMKDKQRDARSFAWLDDARRDFAHAARALRRDPLFTLTAAASLAIGIGANTTIFTVANALLFRSPAGIADSNRLVDVGSSTPGGGFGNSSYPNYLDLRERVTTLEGVYAYSLFPRAMSLGGGEASGGSERIFGTLVTPNYFGVLGAAPAIGRLFGGAEEQQPAAIVLSYAFWSRRFDKDPAIVGRSLTINNRPLTVIGVAAERFQGTGIRAGDLWVPMQAFGESSAITSRAGAWLLVGGRLKRGVGLAQAAAEVSAIGRALASEYPDDNKNLGFRLQSSSPVPGATVPIAVFLALLMAIVAAVLAIACANLAGVLLARAAARRREIAVRLAIGAGRMRLVRQLLAETLTLFSIGGIAGLFLARALTSVLVSLLPALPFPVKVSLTLDGRALLFTATLALGAALFAGLAPAVQASRTDVVSALKDDAQSPFRLRVRQAFVIAQVALSILLVVVAGLFVRALQSAGSRDPGFDPHGVEIASLDLSLAGYTSSTGARFAGELADRLRALPDVRRASLAAVLPGGFETQRRALAVPGVPPPDGQRFFGVDWNIVAPEYFATLGIPMAAGRDFNAGDRAGAQFVAIIGEAGARQFWPGQDPIGRYIVQQEITPAGPNARAARTLRIVGVARDIRANTLIDGPSRSLVYVPLQQQYSSSITIVARSTHGHRIADELRALVLSMDPNLPIVSAQALEDAMALGLVPQRVVVSSSGSLGLVGAMLAAIGIYGVTAYAVARRRREIGIRMALGASRRQVVATILRRGIDMALLGSAIGLPLAAGVSRLFAGFLVGVKPLDPGVFGGAAILFAVVGLVASYVPARRAAQVDPAIALRCE
jgi:putative ABC transport system permease protein